ncbi:hypothetical protein ACIPRI_13600 [Variovorax sp. LARHSF232]
MARTTSLSPYLADTRRLADVIAAIQVMGTYKFYWQDFAGWAERISGDAQVAAYWRNIFEDHPEFFRLDGDRQGAALVWRRQYPKRFHVDEERRLSVAECLALTEAEMERVSREPLSANDIRALIDTAVGLHSRALDQQKERRWWLPLVTAVAALLGAVLGAWLKGR